MRVQPDVTQDISSLHSYFTPGSPARDKLLTGVRWAVTSR